MLSSLHRMIARFWAVFRSSDLDGQLDEELRAHIRLRTEDLVRQGAEPEDAERRARIELGGVAQLRQLHRETRALPFVDTLFQDLRYIVRTLYKAPSFTVLAIATLALGIGITTVVFTTYASVAFRPLAARAPEEIVRFQWHTTGPTSDQFSWSEYERISKAAHSFAQVFATSTPQAAICDIRDSVGRSEQIVHVRFVSSNYFEALGVRQQIGRSFRNGETDIGIVSHEFWRTKLRSDPGVYGTTLTFRRGALLIVGVAPQRFTGTGLPAQTPDIWIPASAQSLVMPGVDWIHDEGVREWQVLAREQRAVRGQGAADVAVLSTQWPKQVGEPVKLSTVKATFFQTNGGAFGSFVQVCAILMVAVTLVLLIGCVNLTHLIAARNSAREQEIAVRLALGASRWRLVQHLCAESLVLGLVGGTAGLLVSYWTCNWLATQSMELIRQITNGGLSIAIDMSPDWQVFAFAAGVSALTGIGIGILPAVRASKRDVNSTLKQGAARAGGGPDTLRNRNLLLAFQVASCLILLAGAGLLFRGAARSQKIDAGFDYKHLAVVGLDTRGMAGSASARVELLRQAVRRIEAVPGVVSITWADRVPFLGTGSGIFHNEQGTALGCTFNGVSDEYFATLGIRLLTGRTFTRAEIEKEPPIAVISESTAKRLWPGQDALGRRISPEATWLRDVVGHESFTVVGIVKSIRSTYLSKDDAGYVYIPRSLHGVGTLFLVRTRTVPDRSFKLLSVALAGVDQNITARVFMSNMEEGPVRMQELMAQAPATVAFILGGLALILACIGIYGVVSHFVSRRKREIGIRMALGATPSDVIAAVSAQTLKPVAWGAGVGLAGAFGISALLRTLIVMPDLPDLTYGAGAFDPLTFLWVLSVLGAVVLLAAFAPVWRATRVDAALALRND